MDYLKFEQKYLLAEVNFKKKKNLEDFIYSKNISKCLSIAPSELRAKQTVSQNPEAGN